VATVLVLLTSDLLVNPEDISHAGVDPETGDLLIVFRAGTSVSVDMTLDALLDRLRVVYERGGGEVRNPVGRV
jgi:hypothetical protein